jgi:hypothetical protein
MMKIVSQKSNFESINSQNTKVSTDDQGCTKGQKSGGQVVLGGDNVSPLVEIGLTDLPKSGGAAAPPASPLGASLTIIFFGES